jgi:transposase
MDDVEASPWRHQRYGGELNVLRRACGVDVHRDGFVATVLSSGGCEARSFEKDLEGMEAFKEWLRESRCRAVVMESTGVYWIPLYAALEGEFDVSLANAQRTRKVSGRKTDQSDSEWLAYLLRSGLIEACYVPERETRVLRELTRLRTKMVQNRTDYKNRVHKVLQRCNIRLGSKVRKVFGKAGMRLLEGLMAGRSLDEIVEGSKVLRERRDELEEVVRDGLDEEDVFILRRCLRMIERLDEEIKEVDGRIAMIMGVREEDARRISRVPGVAQVSASAILAEIGEPKRFENGKKIASWAGLCPSVYQTAEKNLTGRIKQGSKNLRRMMIQVAHAAARTRGSRLRLFYLRVAARRGKKKAIVALARKILCIIHHLLVNGEEFVEEGFAKLPRLRFRALARIPLEEMAEALRCAGYAVRAPG